MKYVSNIQLYDDKTWYIMFKDKTIVKLDKGDSLYYDDAYTTIYREVDGFKTRYPNISILEIRNML